MIERRSTLQVEQNELLLRQGHCRLKLFDCGFVGVGVGDTVRSRRPVRRRE